MEYIRFLQRLYTISFKHMAPASPLVYLSILYYKSISISIYIYIIKIETIEYDFHQVEIYPPLTKHILMAHV
jgi:hypothetical protein